MSADIPGIQSDLRAAKMDGWLFYDFRRRDPIAQRILDLPEGMRTRRWFYFVPAKGAPKKLVHKIETQSLAALPGETLYYAGQDELRKNVKKAGINVDRIEKGIKKTADEAKRKLHIQPTKKVTKKTKARKTGRKASTGKVVEKAGTSGK